MKLEGFINDDPNNLMPFPTKHVSELIKRIESYAKSKRLNKLSLTPQSLSNCGFSGVELLFRFKKYRFNLYIQSVGEPTHWTLNTAGREKQCNKYVLRMLHDLTKKNGLKLGFEYMVIEESLFKDEPGSQKLTEIHSDQQWIEYPQPIPIDDMDKVIEAIDKFRKTISEFSYDWGLW